MTTPATRDATATSARPAPLWPRIQLWFWGKFFILLVALGSGLHRRRMSHNNGIAGRGTLRIVDDPQFPPTEFFEPGRTFPCRVRHATIAYMDDTIIDVRSGSVKFADSDFASPLDIQMNTGHHCFFWDAKSFLEFAFWRHEHGGHEYEKYYRTYADGRMSAASSFRVDPSSFAKMYYHSHTPFAWHAKDGRPRYVRFRLIPGDRGPEDAAPDPAWVEQARNDPELAPKIADQRAVPGEWRDVNYLKKEWRDRVNAGGVSYVLQVQFHEVSDADPPEVRNALMPWDESTHPYMDLATVEITEVLTPAESTLMAFEITNHPPSMSILPATSTRDYNSLNYMRKQVVLAIRVRRALQKLLGAPRDLPDDAPHNQRLPGM
jgi:hypothetical protein